MKIEKKPSISKKSRLVAFLLCYLFGFFGAHRFYVGKNYSGLLFILAPILLVMLAIARPSHLLTIVLLCIPVIAIVIVYFVDLIMIILGKFKTAKGYVVKKWIED